MKSVDAELILDVHPHVLKTIDMNDSVTHIIADYFSHRKEVVAVYLFGSYARAQELPMSDVDVGILLDDAALPEALEKRDRYMVDLSRLLRKDIHPVILNSAGEGLMKQIFSRGKCIAENNHEKHILFRTAMFSRIVDFSYYKNQMQTGLSRKLTELSDGR